MAAITPRTIKVLDGPLWQWDLGRSVVVEPAIDRLHFASLDGTTAMVVVTRTSGGRCLCDVPNELLQSSKSITVFAYEGGRTVAACSLPVCDRGKPDNYVYTPTDIITFEEMRKELVELINQKIDGLQIPQPATLEEVDKAYDDAEEGNNG